MYIRHFSKPNSQSFFNSLLSANVTLLSLFRHVPGLDALKIQPESLFCNSTDKPFLLIIRTALHIVTAVCLPLVAGIGHVFVA
jgi:hypothetical protein